jgi:hypothetical protein
VVVVVVILVDGCGPDVTIVVVVVVILVDGCGPDVTIVVVVVVVLVDGQPSVGAGMMSPWALCSGSSLLETVILMYGLVGESVRWQIVTLSCLCPGDLVAVTIFVVGIKIAPTSSKDMMVASVHRIGLRFTLLPLTLQCPAEWAQVIGLNKAVARVPSVFLLSLGSCQPTHRNATRLSSLTYIILYLWVRFE